MEDRPFKWRGRYQCAVTLSVDFDAETLRSGTFALTTPSPMSRGDYDIRAGLPRILELFDGLDRPSHAGAHTASASPPRCRRCARILATDFARSALMTEARIVRSSSGMGGRFRLRPTCRVTIPDVVLTADCLPPAGADPDECERFALRTNGYKRPGTFGRCADLANVAIARWRDTGALPQPFAASPPESDPLQGQRDFYRTKGGLSPPFASG